MELNLEDIFVGAASVDPGTFVHPSGTLGNRLPVEHPGVEGTGQAGRTRMVSQKSKEKIADRCGNDLIPRSSLFLDNGCARRYNSIIVS